uniref:Uncharacterized protein n=1 Tax=Fundulus heteroclitus TaxID=8078 RepID=A0A3Q2NPS3_FUNHE
AMYEYAFYIQFQTPVEHTQVLVCGLDVVHVLHSFFQAGKDNLPVSCNFGVSKAAKVPLSPGVDNQTPEATIQGLKCSVILFCFGLYVHINMFLLDLSFFNVIQILFLHQIQIPLCIIELIMKLLLKCLIYRFFVLKQFVI